jgi:hypothetical protein
MDEVKSFKYTANKDEFSGLALGFSFLIVAEAIGIELVLLFLLEGWLKWLVLLLMLILHVYFLDWLYAPLRTTHFLTPSHLKLRYGWTLKADISREDIATATAWKKPITKGEPIMPRYVKERERLIANFSPDGQVLLTLKNPLQLKLSIQKVKVQEILINVDNRIDFLAALHLPASQK